MLVFVSFLASVPSSVVSISVYLNLSVSFEIVVVVSFIHKSELIDKNADEMFFHLAEHFRSSIQCVIR